MIPENSASKTAIDGPRGSKYVAPKDHVCYAARVALAVLIAYLLSPMIIQTFSRDGLGLSDPLVLFNLLTSLLWLALAHFLSTRPVLLHAALAPLYLTTAIDLFLLATFGNRLSAGYVTIALTSHLDTTELFATYARQLWIVGSVLVLVYVPALYAVRHLRVRKSNRLAAIAAACLLLIYGTATGRGIWFGASPAQAALDVVGHETSAPIGALFQAGLALKQHMQTSELRRNRDGFSFGASKAVSDETEVYVLVIGESSRPQNWSLFGYTRDTTPRVRAAGVIGWPHVLTTAPHTAIAVPSMLSLQPITNWDGILAQKSIVGAFNEAGFKTYWLSAQPDDNWAGIIPQLAAEAQHRRYYDNQFDGAMLEEYRNILQATPRGGKILIVLHTKGSHFDYRRRYPPAFERFSTLGGSRRDALLDAYDNSVFYTDWLLGELIGELQRRPVSAALVFASDHGENLLDDDRQLLGHALGNAYDLPAASFVWMSDKMRRSHPVQALSVERNALSPVSLSNLSHSLLDLADIEALGLDRTLSLFSPSLVIRRRSYIVRGELRQEEGAAAATQ